jgi:hypothetical protein
MAHQLAIIQGTVDGAASVEPSMSALFSAPLIQGFAGSRRFSPGNPDDQSVSALDTWVSASGREFLPGLEWKKADVPPDDQSASALDTRVAPRLVISWTGTQNRKRHRPQPRRRVLAEVIQLDRRSIGGTLTYHDVVLPLGGFLEDCGQGVPQLLQRAIATEADLLAGGIAEREVEPYLPTLAKASSISSAGPRPVFLSSVTAGFVFHLCWTPDRSRHYWRTGNSQRSGLSDRCPSSPASH